jgi:hypothetical protein
MTRTTRSPTRLPIHVAPEAYQAVNEQQFRQAVDDRVSQLEATTDALGTDVDALELTAAALGTISTQNANSVAITGGSIAGITDLAIADGGTGSSTAVAARAALGVRFMSTMTLYRSPQTALVGPIPNTWAFPGTGVTASLIQWRADYPGMDLEVAYWRVIWDPNGSGAGQTGVRLVHADSGPSNITSIVAQTDDATGSVRNDAFDVTSTLQGFLDSETYKQIGHQMIGNATTAANLYMSELELIWK